MVALPRVLIDFLQYSAFVPELQQASAERVRVIFL
jgi:hypothetical protein